MGLRWWQSGVEPPQSKKTRPHGATKTDYAGEWSSEKPQSLAKEARLCATSASNCGSPKSRSPTLTKRAWGTRHGEILRCAQDDSSWGVRGGDGGNNHREKPQSFVKAARLCATSASNCGKGERGSRKFELTEGKTEACAERRS